MAGFRIRPSSGLVSFLGCSCDRCFISQEYEDAGNVQTLDGEAASILDQNLMSTPFPTQALQAAVWLKFALYVSGDLTGAWLLHVKTCQVVAMLGLERIDSPRPRRRMASASWPSDGLELEEQRKTVWYIFALDRFFCCNTGFALALDDRNFHINFPVKNDIFQAVKSWVEDHHVFDHLASADQHI